MTTATINLPFMQENGFARASRHIALALRKKQDMAVVSWSEIAPLLAGFESDAGALRYFKLDYAVAPGEVQDFLKKLPATTAKYDGVGSDTVLNAEIMADVEKSRES